MKKRSKRMVAILLIMIVVFTGTITDHLSGFMNVKSVDAVTILSNPVYNKNTDFTTWDCIWFGKYWQNDTNMNGIVSEYDDKDPIKWRILSVTGNYAFLLADKNIDVRPYNIEDTDITWKGCTLRSWLNGYGSSENEYGQSYVYDNFIDNAFSDKEKMVIKDTVVINEDNPDYGTKGGYITLDKVYLLSAAEAANSKYGFNPNLEIESATRIASNTEYVSEHDEMFSAGSMDCWWLRSPGYSASSAVFVSVTGYGDMGTDVGSECYAIRPVMYLNIADTTLWSYAGTVCSDGTEKELAPAISGTTGKPTITALPTRTPEVTGKPYLTPTPTQSHTATSTPISTIVPTTKPTTKPTAKPAGAYGLLNPVTSGRTTWDCIWFGNYWQNDTNKDGKADKRDAKEPIKWRILSVDETSAFLLADNTLEYKPYNEIYINALWENCTLRSWLNGYPSSYNICEKNYKSDNFMNAAFSSQEQYAISYTNIMNKGNTKYGTEGGNITIDKIFLLSIEEISDIEYGFSAGTEEDTYTRRAYNSMYVNQQEKETFPSGAGWWWLRSPGVSSISTSYIEYFGKCDMFGSANGYGEKAVRPALYLNLLNTKYWSYAGTVCSDGTKSEIAPPVSSPAPKIVKNVKKPSVSPKKNTSVKKKGIKVGQTIKPKKSKHSYRIVSITSKGGTVSFVNTKSKGKNVTIPASITYAGKKYKVVSIAKNAFLGNKTMRTVVIGKKVKYIGACAFKNCKALTNIIVKSTVLKKIGKNAFQGTKKRLIVKPPKNKREKYKKLFTRK